MPHPEGYRKAMRVMELAERFGLPIVTFVDVPGAHPGPESEERGIAEAIARSIGLMSRLRTPIVAVITGEGGSGGALAIAVGDVVIALENAVYSVISPEGCASILWRTADEAAGGRAGDEDDRRGPARRSASSTSSCPSRARAPMPTRRDGPAPAGDHRRPSWTALAALTLDELRRGALPPLPGARARTLRSRLPAVAAAGAAGSRRSAARPARPGARVGERARVPAWSRRTSRRLARRSSACPMQAASRTPRRHRRAKRPPTGAADHAAIDRLADELLPALIAKLGATGLGELEVREGAWRVRLRRPADRDRERRRPGERPRTAGRADRGCPAVERRTAGSCRGRPGSTPVGPGRRRRRDGRDGRCRWRDSRRGRRDVTGGRHLPARPEAAAGHAVRAGDSLGTVDMLGVAQEVVGAGGRRRRRRASSRPATPSSTARS